MVTAIFRYRHLLFANTSIKSLALAFTLTVCVALPGLTVESSAGQASRTLSFTGWEDLARENYSALDTGSTPLLQMMGGDDIKLRILQEYRLESLLRRVLQRGQRRIYIDVYEFGDAQGALAAYYYLRKGATTVVKRGDLSSEEDDSISFVLGRTFVSIYGTSQDDEESKDVIRKAADILVKNRDADAAAPDVMRFMPTLDRVSGSEKLVAGQMSARRFCLAPHLPSLFGDTGEHPLKIWGCVADYQITAPVKERLRMLLLEYPNEEIAAKRYASYMQNLQANREATPLAGSSSVYRLATSYIGTELRGRFIGLVTGAKKRFSPQLLLRQMRN